MSASFLDTRIAIMLGFLLFAAVDPARLPRQSRRVVAAGLRAVRGAHGGGGGGLGGTSARPRRSAGRHRRRSAGGLGLHDQRAAARRRPLTGMRGRAAGGSRTRCVPSITCPRCCSSSAARSGRCCSPIPHSSRSACGPPTPGWLARRTTSPPTPPWWLIPERGSRCAARLRFRPDAGSRSGCRPARLCPEVPHPGVAAPTSPPCSGCDATRSRDDLLGFMISHASASCARSSVGRRPSFARP